MIIGGIGKMWRVIVALLIAAVMLFDGTSRKLSVQLTANRPGAPSARSKAGCIDSGASP